MAGTQRVKRTHGDTRAGWSGVLQAAILRSFVFILKGAENHKRILIGVSNDDVIGFAFWRTLWLKCMKNLDLEVDQVDCVCAHTRVLTKSMFLTPELPYSRVIYPFIYPSTLSSCSSGRWEWCLIYPCIPSTQHLSGIQQALNDYTMNDVERNTGEVQPQLYHSVIW